MIRTANIITLGAVALACGLTSCNTCVTSSGKHISQERAVGAFTGIDLSNSFDVEISIGDTPSVTVEGADNIVGLITTEVRDGMLVIDTKSRSCIISDGDKDAVVHVTIPSLQSVVLNGSGSIRSKGKITGDSLAVLLDGSGDIDMEVEVASLTTSSDGSGDITLHGGAAAHRASLSGSGDVDAAPLMTKKTWVEVDGSGSARVNAAEEIHAQSSGSGDIEYFGDPRVADVSAKGSGDVQRGAN